MFISKNKKIIQFSVLSALIISILFSVVGFEAQCKGIRSSVVRLHILANSDSNEDQKLKLCIRDNILENSAYLFDGMTDKKTAIKIIEQNLENLQQIAQQTVYEKGYGYPVTVQIGTAYFDTRRYTNAVFPAGVYDSLIVTVGKGEGKNWWCVMFPPICISAASETVDVDDVLTEKQQDIVNNNEKYVCRFWIVEKYYSIKNFICNLF
ncbi:MAG: stage II sporulation protein R [Clostridia bacterium]|nr:stage II sporulation protein R [Clostridia bacterium]